MSRVLNVAAVRQAEADAVASGSSEFELMLSAGQQAADIINFHYPQAVRFLILCGGGNNGGDALVAARFLFKRYHREVAIYCVKQLSSLKGCAAQAVETLPREIEVFESTGFERRNILPGDVIIDGLLGIGFDGGALRPEIKRLIEVVNRSACPVVALDLPSGVNADIGAASPDGAVEADLTITFGAVKPGLFAGEGRALRGKLRLAEIGLPMPEANSTNVFTHIDAVDTIVTPACDCHKNSRGRVLVWGGSGEYPGAPVLSARGALSAGSGIVRLISCGDCRELAPAAVIVKKILNGSEIRGEVLPYFGMSDVLVAGCGWGNETPVEALDAVWEFPGKMILDADALNMFSRHPEKWRKSGKVLITPHPGEAARLAEAFGVEAEDRSDLAEKLAEKLGCVVLLKGHDSVIASPDCRKVLVAAGNYQLATAGSGDVLAGIIAAQAAKLPVFEAAVLGAYIHGVAGEKAKRVITADELPELAGEAVEAMRKNFLF